MRKRTKALDASGAPTPECQHLIKNWNDLVAARCPNIPSVMGIRPVTLRLRMVEARLNEPGFAEAFVEVCRRISRNRFLRGDRHRPGDAHAGWSASFDWIIRPDSWLKVLEGHYDRNGNVDAGSVVQPAAPSTRLLTHEERRRLFAGTPRKDAEGDGTGGG